jgi:hypothetical protein
VADRDERSARVVVAIVDGLPLDLAADALPSLPFLGARLTHRATAVSCFPSTTGPAYFPFLSGCTPGRANIPGIRWFDRTRTTPSAFPHRGLRSYVGPDARRLATDTRATTLFARHAWPVSSPIGKDLPKRGELSRDLVWAAAHFSHRWDRADRRTSWKLGRALNKDREIVFAVFPSVDEFGHTFGIASNKPRAALEEIDRQLAEKLEGFDGELLLSADHGLTDTHTHIDLRGVVEALVGGTTIAYPVITKRFPEAVVCESGNAMANVYIRGENGWADTPAPDRCRELAARLLEIEGIESIALRSEGPASAELWTREGVGHVGFDDAGLSQSGAAFARDFQGVSPSEALALSVAERNPDAAFALTSLFASERTGDLLVSATTGFDLRTRSEWPEHHASHGGIHRDHTVVPVFASSPLPDRPLRTLDLFALTLERAGIPLEEYPQSDTSLLADGRWRPEGVALRTLLHKVWAWLNRWFHWIALVGVVIGLTLAVRGQWGAITELDWAGSWRVVLASAVFFSAAPLAQACTFWIILRLLGARAPFGEAMVIWAHSYVLRYAPSGALAVVFRVRGRARLRATREQILAAEAYEHLGSMTAAPALACSGSLRCERGRRGSGSPSPSRSSAWPCCCVPPSSGAGRRRSCGGSESRRRSSAAVSSPS